MFGAMSLLYGSLPSFRDSRWKGFVFWRWILRSGRSGPATPSGLWDSSKAEIGEAEGASGKPPVLPLCRAPPSVVLGPSDSLVQWTR